MEPGIVIVMGLFLLVLVLIAWALLPFFVLGTNKRLDQLIAEVRKLNQGSPAQMGTTPRTPVAAPKALHVDRRTTDGRLVIE